MSSDVAVQRPRWSVAPYFVVDDVVATANYYRDKLGFEYDRFWGEPPTFCMVCRNGVVIMLGQLEQTGVMRPNQHYGCRDFDIEDCNGYRLCLGQDLEGD